MTGVEILTEEVVYNNLFPFWFILALAVAIVVAILVSLATIDTYPVLGFSLLPVVLGAFVIIWLSPIQDKNSIDHIEYKVTISDDVSFTEFNEKYEILEQDGKIYTVREKTE